MGAEIDQLELELEDRHKKELEEWKQKGESGGGDSGAIEGRMEGLNLTSHAAEEKEAGEARSAANVAGGAGKKSRAQKRKVINSSSTCVLYP